MRGLRAATDFEYELQIAHANADLEPDVDTVFLPTRTKNGFISASLVREIASHGGDVSRYAPGWCARRWSRSSRADCTACVKARRMASISQSPPSSIAARLDDSVFAIRKRVDHRAARRGRPRQRSRRLRRHARGAGEDPVPRSPAHGRVRRAGHAGNLCFGDVGGRARRLHAGPRSPLRGAPGRQGRPGRAHHGAARRALRAPHQRRRRARAHLVGGRPDGRDRSPEPHRHVAARRPERRRARPALSRHDDGLRRRAARLAAGRRAATPASSCARGSTRGSSARRTRRRPRCAWCGRSARRRWE